jgi:hypothetical protein
VEFDPKFHSHLFKCAFSLLNELITLSAQKTYKKAIFAFILELLNQENEVTFFTSRHEDAKTHHTSQTWWRPTHKNTRPAKQEHTPEITQQPPPPPPPSPSPAKPADAIQQPPLPPTAVAPITTATTGVQQSPPTPTPVKPVSTLEDQQSGPSGGWLHVSRHLSKSSATSPHSLALPRATDSCRMRQQTSTMPHCMPALH